MGRQIDRQDRNKKIRKACAVDLFAVTVIFLILYNSFLFGGQMYAYCDVGADTVDQYLPNICYETELIRSGELEGYQLSYGFGKHVAGLLLEYLNPVNLPLLLLGQSDLPAALMLSLYLKYVLICLFALLYFCRILKNEKVASLCALLWTFSGYAVLWGQHYHFLTMILAFTVVMYGFQLYLEADKHWYAVIAGMALLFWTSYYFAYITCFFLIIYGVVFLLHQAEPVGRILKKAVVFVPVAVLAACIAGETLAVDVATFFGSFRVGQVTSQTAGDWHYPMQYVYGYLARFFSNDLLGTGDTFYGPVNYYEFAVLSVSILSVFSVVYLLLGKYWKRVILICVGCAAALCLPSVNQLLTFSRITQRWTYLLCFVQVLGIGFAFAEAAQTSHERKGRNRILLAILITDLLLLLSAVVLYRYHIQTGGWILNKSACIKLAIIIGAYHIGGIAMLARRKYAFGILLTLVVIELSLANYASVNQRNTISVEQWESGMYHDGTEDVVQWIRQQDPSLYRISKTYTSVSNCDAMMQGFNGTATYDSTNSAALITLADAFGYSGVGNRVHFAGNDLLANTMLGVKYVIAHTEEALDPLVYTKIYSDETYCVYENKYWLGFGTVYRKSAQQEDVLAQTTVDSLAAMTDSFYYTEDSTGELQDRTVSVDLLPYLTGSENCEVAEGEAITVVGTGYNMQLQFALPEIPQDHLVAGIRITITAQSASTVTVVTACETEYGTETRRDVVNYGAGTGTYVLNTVNNPAASSVSLYASWAPQTVIIESMDVLLLPGLDTLRNNLQELQDSRINMEQVSRNVFVCTMRDSMDEGMAVLPLIYSPNWRATVDGESAEVYNVNGGLVGIPLKSGASEVRIEYCDSSYRLGCALTLIGILAYTLLIMKYRKQNVIKEKG